MEKLTSKGTRKSTPTDGEDVKSEGHLRDCMCLCVCTPVWEEAGDNSDPGWKEGLSKILGAVCPGEIHSVHVYVLLCARKSVPATGVGLWGLGKSVSRCQQLDDLGSTASYWMS